MYARVRNELHKPILFVNKKGIWKEPLPSVSHKQHKLPVLGIENIGTDKVAVRI